MSDGSLRVKPGELTADELLQRLHEGDRVVIERELLGGIHEITLRYDGETYYCDTPTTLHRHATVDGMRSCLAEQQYTKA